MIEITPRPLSSAELDVVVAAIRRAPYGDGFKLDEDYLASHLSVVGRCDCGCASVFFSTPEWTSEHHRVADGKGSTAEGEDVDVIVWATLTGLAHLELVSYSERPAQLPDPFSVS